MTAATRRGAAWKTRRRRAGQSLVELALLLPLLTLILLGTTDLGRAFFYHVRLTNAVREGVLFGAQYPTYVIGSSRPGYSEDPNNITYRVQAEQSSTVTVVCYRRADTTFATPLACDNPASGGAIQDGDWIEVRATYAFRPFTLQLFGLFPNGLSLRKSVKMVVMQ
jgi:Flp pilus assembly protein TadG